MSFNLATMLREAALAHPGKACLIADDGTVLTYSELESRSDAVAQGLRHLGLAVGDRVALQLPNGVEFVESYFAVVRAGMVAVPINPQLKAAEIGYVLGDCQARLLITSADCLPQAWAAVDCLPQTPAAADDRAADSRVAIAVVGEPTPGAGSPSGEPRPGGAAVVPFAALRRPRPRPDIAATAADDSAVLIYTSGTTGKPKGAELTHFQLYMNCTVSSEMGGVSHVDVALGVLPLFHVFGLSTVLNTVIRRAATLLLVNRFVPAEVLDRMRQHDVTLFYGVPTMFIGLLDPLRDADPLTSLRLAYSGGASIPVEVIRQFERALPNVTVLEGYGLSETGASVSFNRNADERKLLSVGRPLWGVQVGIVDDSDEPLPAGQDHIGEVVVRGYNVMKAYYGLPEATAEALKGGWLHTGDLGYLDDDGYLFIVDRKKELIVRGGYNVYPREVEEVLYGHPAVNEAAVVGVPDDRLGEEVRAVVSLNAGHQLSSEELIGYCRDRMANYKYPRQVRIVDELPKGSTGKILKTALKAQAVDAHA